MNYISNTCLQSESNKCEEFFDALELYVDKKQFIVQREIEALNGLNLNLRYVEKEGAPWAYIAFYDLKKMSDLKIVEQRLADLTKKHRASFAVLTDRNFYHLYEVSNECSDFQSVSYQQVLDKVLLVDNLNNEKVFKIVKELISCCGLPIPMFDTDTLIIENNSIYLSEQQEEKIKEHFDIKANVCKVCRYMPLEKAVEFLTKKELRMNGIVGMKDSSEINFLEKYLYEDVSSITSDNNIENANKIFISCFTSENKKDDLNMWRLYGDNACGVCLVFDVIHQTTEKFVIRRVQYLDENKREEKFGKLKKLLKQVKSMTNFTLTFQKFHEWSHFYKPNIYEIEDEIRLFTFNNDLKREMFLAKPLNIINYFIKPTLEEKGGIILKLSEIIIGPNCPEKEINLEQIRLYVNSDNNDKIKVRQSNISVYR